MKTYKKIDLYYAGEYLCSTNQAKTCREARENYLKKVKKKEYSEALIKFVSQKKFPTFSNMAARQIFRNQQHLTARFSK